MFRIKTDIRQYKCETKDKVEKLIRNWVIRPTDLIYNTDQREWLPIGEHPSFMQLFGVLDEQERNTPDTVVTAESPYRSAGYVNGSDGPSVPVEDDAAHDEREDQQPVQAPDHDEENAEEVTHIVGIDDVDGAPASTGDEGVAVAESEDGAAGDDSRRTDVFDQEDIARDFEAVPHPTPPSAPEGLEPPVNDEVTTMTERTLEMLKITDEGDEVDRDAISEGSELDDPNAEPSVIVEPQVTEDEVTDIRNKAEVQESSDPSIVSDAEDSVDEAAPPEAVAPAAERKPRLGRHDLPEELFATNEISAPEIREKLEMMDELGELSEPSENTNETTNKKPLKEKNGQEVTTRLQEDSGVNEAWDEIAEDVRATSEVSETDEDGAELEPLRQTDEFPAEDLEDDEFEEDELEEDELEEDEDEDEGEGEWGDDTSEPHIDPRDFVSDGYKIPLPYQVGPTPDDIRRGLKVSRASLARKDRVYPVPEPKKLDEIHRRVFDLTPVPPRDHTLLIVVVFFISIGIIVSLVSC